MPMSVEKALAIGVSSAPRAAAARAGLGVGGAHGNIERHRGGVADRARGRGQRAHLHQHPLDVGMHDDGVRIAIAGLPTARPWRRSCANASAC